MTHSTQLYGQLFGCLRQYCRVQVRKARWLLRQHPDVMRLADRGFANHQLMQGLQASRWHYCFRLPCDVLLHGASQCPSLVANCPHPWEKLACKDGNSCLHSHCSRKTQNLVLPRIGLSKIFMTRFGLLGFVP